MEICNTCNTVLIFKYDLSRNVILGHARREGVTYDTYHESVGRVEENSLESSFHMPQLARTR